MNDKDDFALVPRPPSAVEKTKPGAKRILSAMITDTLAVAKKDQIETTPKSLRIHSLRIVMVYSNPEPFKCLEFFIRLCFENIVLVTLVHLQDRGEEAWTELSRIDPDLLIMADAMPFPRGEEIIRRLLDRKASYPIILVSSSPPVEKCVQECAAGGLNVMFLGMPFDWNHARNLLGAALKIPVNEIHFQRQ